MGGLFSCFSSSSRSEPRDAPAPSPQQLLEAVKAGDAPRVRRYLEQGVSANSVDTFGSTQTGLTPLHVACEQGNPKIVSLLLENDAFVHTRAGEHKKTPLHLAARSGSVEVVQKLLQKGAEVDARTAMSATPLHSAAGEGHAEVVRILLEHQADPNVAEQNLARPLHRATGRGNESSLRLLLEHGADVNAKGWESWTALHYAAYNGNAHLVGLLCEYGADANACTKDGKRPLDVAKERQQASGHLDKYTEAIEILTTQTAALALPNGNGNSAPLTTVGLLDRVPSNPPPVRSNALHPGGMDSIIGPVFPPSTTTSAKSISNRGSVNASFMSKGSTKGSEASWGGGSSAAQLLPNAIAADLIREGSRDAADGSGTRTPSVNNLDQVLADATQWDSVEIAELRVMQDLKEGACFGHNNRYQIRSVAAGIGVFTVAKVQDTLEGMDYFAKFFAHSSNFEAEKAFYTSWTRMPTERRKAANDSWPVVKDFFAKGDLPNIRAACIIMEQGFCTLQDRLKLYDNRKLEVEERAKNLLTVFESVAKALRLMHENGWVHRDIKPENVMWFHDVDCWKVVDFGIAARAGENAPVQYTLHYAAPEVVAAHIKAEQHVHVGPALDLWSLGMTMLVAFSCEPPFKDCTDKEWLQMLMGSKKFPFEEEGNKFFSNTCKLPKFAEDLVKPLLQRDPNKRMSLNQFLHRRVFRPAGTIEAAGRQAQELKDEILKEFKEMQVLVSRNVALSVQKGLLVCINLLRLPWDKHRPDLLNVDEDWYTNNKGLLEEVLYKQYEEGSNSHYLLNLPPTTAAAKGKDVKGKEAADSDAEDTSVVKKGKAQLANEWLYMLSVRVYHVAGAGQEQQPLMLEPDCGICIIPAHEPRSRPNQLRVLHSEANDFELHTVALWGVGPATTPWLTDPAVLRKAVPINLQLHLKMQGGAKGQELVRQQTIKVAPHPNSEAFLMQRAEGLAKNLQQSVPDWVNSSANTVYFCFKWGQEIGLWG